MSDYSLERGLPASNGETSRSLGSRFGVSDSAIAMIKRGIHWEGVGVNG